MNYYRAIFDALPFDQAIERVQQDAHRAWGYPGLDATWTTPLPAPGWECPRCHRIYAPWYPVCDHCNTEVDEREGEGVAA